MRMNIAAALTAGTILVSLAGCSAAPESTPTSETQITTSAEEISEMTTEKTTSTETSATSEMTIQTEETTTVTEAERSMTLKIGEKEVQVTWEDNASVEDLKRSREISCY